MTLRCRFPDGSLSPCVRSTLTIGRGSPACLTDPACSRRQFELTPVAVAHGRAEAEAEVYCLGLSTAQHVHAGHSTHAQQQQQQQPPELRLKAVGANPVVVCQPRSDGGWDQVFLGPGKAMVVRAGMRFQVTSRADATTVELVMSQGGGGGEGGGSSAGGGAAALQGAAEAAPAAAPAAEATAVGSSSKREEQEDDGNDGMEIDKPLRASNAGAAAASAGGAQGETAAAVGTSAADCRGGAGSKQQEEEEDGFEIIEPPTGASNAAAVSGRAAKRARRSEAPGGDRGASTSAGADGGGGGSSSSSSDSVPPMWTAPFSLLRVDGLSDQHNSGCLGASLEDLVQGPITTAIVSNFMIDMEWLLKTAPALASVKQMLVLHGTDWAEAKMTRACLQADTSAHTVLYKPHLPLNYGTHHSKFLLLEYGPNGVYPGGLRVIITTANFVPRDCRNKCQGLWWQDFPRASSSSSNGVGSGGSAALPPCAAGDFGEYLTSYLAFALRQLRPENSAWKATAVRLCRDHDFSAAHDHLVASAPGIHKGNAIQRWGHMRVRALLSRSHQIPPAMRDVSGALHSGPDGVLKAMTESFDKLYGGETKLSDETLNQLENDVAAFELTRATEVDEAHGRPPDLAETEACVRALRSAAAPGR
ncbi:hypothetical protein FOA52_013400 [Chlamydomonas sp. UWO 241]|nr:hypothetical protein FOA52_013400 [Chlamydomonas sp. UWO 241]